MRLETLALRWLAEQRYAETTHQTYMQTVRLLAQRFPLPAERITAEHLIDFLTLDDKAAPTRLAPATLERHRVTICRMFRWAHRRGLLRRNPAADLDELSLGRGRRRAGRWLTRDQAVLLLDSIDVSETHLHRDHTLILTTLLTGLRRAELAGLRWRDIDLDHRRLHVFGKGSKPAVIGLPDEAHDGLASWRLRAMSEAGRAARADSPVFPTGRMCGGIHGGEPFYRMDWRRPMTVANVRIIVARHAAACGLGTVAPHDLRRTFAGWLDEDGVDLAGIQAALRHSSPGVTVACYLEPSPRRAVEATRSLRIA